MDILREYLFLVTISAILCGIISALAQRMGNSGATIKYLCGIFMVVTLVTPFTEIGSWKLMDYHNEIISDAEDIVRYGEAVSEESMATNIKERLTAYILEKAEVYGADIFVEITLDDSFLSVPTGIRISGTISPYGKTVLQEMLEQDIGIRREDQKWMLQS